ncbi:MAG: 1-deoxy-D-xylulose-5-phosphate synthase [Candidatus Omnitrophica bacterium]|nr:1-deoxy-D-xylulose-5-phosphate synthase [Candidatus Omnitrophota bacterium]
MLEKINNPHDLKKLTTKELRGLCREIRELIIKVVSRRGGHLASSLGAVELSVALNYCLNLPLDALIFDVGHQCYAHKILTGRRDRFHSLRQYKGISGFPNPAESDCDSFISGHASTAVSWAQGLAEAARMKKEKAKAVAVIGDGSLTGGMCFEALNNCGHSQSDVLVILNHNEMSISSSVGALSNYLNKIISAPVYNRLRNELESFLEHFSLTKKLNAHARKFEEALKGLMVPGIFFEELGFRYFGPIDGHNLGVLIPTIKNIISLKGPKLLHVVTKKGKGYKFAEENPEEFHGASPFNVETSAPLAGNSESFGEVFARKLAKLSERDNRLVAITAAMPKGTGLNIFAEKFPEKVFDVGIAEEHAVGFAAGLAKKGFKPVVAIYSTFLQRALDQIIHDVALQKLSVIFAIDRAGAVGEDGPTHHGVFDVGYLRFIPNMICLAPKDKEELEDCLEFAALSELAVSIRYPKGAAYSMGFRERVSLGKGQIIREGKDVCIIGLGSMVKNAYQAAVSLSKEGIEATIINPRFIKPLDEELFSFVGNNFKQIFIIEEGSISCGFGSAVLEFFQKEELLQKTKVNLIGFPDEFLPCASRNELFRMYRLDTQSLIARVKNTIGEKTFSKN